MDLHPQRILSLCSGVGGLDLGVRVALPSARTVCCVEHEAFAAEILASRMEDDSLDAAPIWSDLRTFDGAPWRGLVDGIIGGYPCQPFSQAGKRKGEADPRHLWPVIRDLIGQIRPAWCFFENVRGHLTLGFDLVHRNLQELGYKVEAGLFSAEEVGASHRRERLFIFAVSAGDDRRLEELRDALWSSPASGRPASPPVEDTFRRGSGSETGNPEGRRRDGPEDRGALLPDNPGREDHQPATNPGPASGTDVADPSDYSELAHPPGERGQLSAPRRLPTVKKLGAALEEVHVFAPGPEDPRWPDILHEHPNLAPAIESGLRMLDHGLELVVDESRIQQLRATGNGVVPLQAAYAFTVLAGKAFSSTCTIADKDADKDAGNNDSKNAGHESE